MRRIEFGRTYLMHSILCSSGLMQALSDAYGDDVGRRLAAVCITDAADRLPPRRIPLAMSRNASIWICGAPLDTWIDLETMYDTLSKAGDGMKGLFSRLDSGNPAVVMELTSLGTEKYRNGGIMCPDDMHPPGHMVYLAVDGVGNLPFAYNLVDESLDRADTLLDVSDGIRSMGARGIHFVLDALENPRDLPYLVNRGITFTCMLPPVFEESIVGDQSESRPRSQMATVGGCLFSCSEHTVPMGDGKIRLLHVRNEDLRLDLREEFLGRMDRLVEIASGMRWGSSVGDRLSKMGFSKEMGFVDLSCGPNRFTSCVPIRDRTDRYADSLGTFLISTTSDLGWKELVSVLVRREMLESELERFRTDATDPRDRNPCLRMMDSLIPLWFLHMYLQTSLENSLAAAGCSDRADDTLCEFGNLDLVETGDGWILDDLTPEQARILAMLRISRPSRASVSAISSRIP